jgi:hypothetical protein
VLLIHIGGCELLCDPLDSKLERGDKARFAILKQVIEGAARDTGTLQIRPTRASSNPYSATSSVMASNNRLRCISAT